MNRLLLVSSLLAGLAIACGGNKPTTDNPEGGIPTAEPTAAPTADPTAAPTADPTAAPTAAPTASATASAPMTPVAMVAAGNADNGKKLYEEQKCNGCHGTTAKPPAKFPNPFKMKWDDEKTITKSMDVIKAGKAPMPAYKDKLDDKQIADVLAYFKANPAK